MNQKIDPIGIIILSLLFGFIFYAAIISYKNIDFQILKKLESQPLILPTVIPTLKP